MRKTLLLALVACGLIPGSVQALELKNVRATCGPFGVPRLETKFLPGDVLFLHYDIEGLQIDPETGLAQYLVGMELFDSADKSIFKQKDTPAQVVAALGGTTLPGYASFYMGTDQKPGKYTAKISITDRVSEKKATYSYQFELIDKAFGFVQPGVPSIGFVSQEIGLQFGIVGMAKNDKKVPNVEVITRILDEKTEKPTLTKPVNIFYIPKDVPPEVKVETRDVVIVPVPVYLNRPGRFIVEVEALDQVTKKSIKARYPLNVVDPIPAGK
jgi:hypothetical protein